MNQTELRASPPAGSRLVPFRKRARGVLAELAEVPTVRADRVAGDREFLPVALGIIEAPPSRGRALLGYALSGLIAAVLIWSCFARIAVYARAPGVVDATGRTRVVEPLWAGQVHAIHVKDGDHVKQNDILVELDPTAALANQTAIANKVIDLRAEIARLRVEMAMARSDSGGATAVPWDGEIPQNVREREEGVLHANLARLAATLADLVAQREKDESLRDKFTAGIDAQKSLIAVLAEHVAMHEKLAAMGVESRATLLDALVGVGRAKTELANLQGSFLEAVAAIATADSQIAMTTESFIANDTQQLAKADRQLDDLVQQLTKASSTLGQMTLRAPLSGTIEALAVTTMGQVVQPGQQLMQLIPDSEKLEIVAYVLNTDIGFIRSGQSATIKVDTFPYTRYGTIAGTVTEFSSDAMPGKEGLQQQKNGSRPPSHGTASDTAPAEPTGDLVFPVTITPASSSILVEGENRPLSVGMSVAVEIETDEQRVISYILSTLVHGIHQQKSQ